jgi:hypothetical protein
MIVGTYAVYESGDDQVRKSNTLFESANLQIRDFRPAHLCIKRLKGVDAVLKIFLSAQNCCRVKKPPLQYHLPHSSESKSLSKTFRNPTVSFFIIKLVLSFFHSFLLLKAGSV